MKVYIETYGCSSSHSDSEIMAGLLNEAGHEIVDDITSADVVIVNTCIVKQPTESKIRFRLQQLQEKYPKKKLIIAGCMPEAEPEALRNIAKNASLISTNQITSIADVASNKGRLELLGKNKQIKCDLPKIRKNPVIDVVEISSGCSYSCAYCITKLAKGPLLSYPHEKIIKEITSSLENGAKEFWITGQDVAGYLWRSRASSRFQKALLSENDNEINLPGLLNEVSKIEGDYFLRLGMMNPASVMPMLYELIKAYKNEHVFKFLHLPVQSGSDSILKLMNRKYTANDYRNIIKKFREGVPEITIWTDVIVGFPEESDEDFEQTTRLIEEIKPDFTNISAFGARPGTKAAGMRQVDNNSKKGRTGIISKIVDEICLEQNRRWLGWEGRIIIDEYNTAKKNWIGRNNCYKPVAVKGRFSLGQIIDVKIAGVEKTCLIGSKTI